MSISSRNELKTGKRPEIKQVRCFKDGEILFTEGSVGRELFVISEGTVGVYKNGPEGKVELARIGEGGMVGEMSLLDTLPRSATVIAQGNVKVVVIGYTQFKSVMDVVPVWLQGIIKIVVSRLRDANSRVDQPVLRDKERGLLALLRLMLPVNGVETTSGMLLSRAILVNEACSVCRMRKKEVAEICTQLVKRSIIADILHDGSPYYCITDSEVLGLYGDYLSLKAQKKTFSELELSEGALSLLSNIAYIAQKLGRETDEGTLLTKKSLVEDLACNESTLFDKELAELGRKNCVTIVPSDSGYSILFQKQSLVRIKKIKEWIPRFSMEVP